MRKVWLGVVLVAVAALALVAWAQDPLKVLPKNYWMEFERPWVKVIHAHYPAGETLATHDHPASSTLYVYLNDAGSLRFLHTGEAPATRPPVKTGQMRVAAAKAETHRVENVSATDSDSVRVEFQTFAFAEDMPDVRIPAAVDPSGASGSKVVFEDAHLRVTRLGVLPGAAVKFESGEKHVLWIAVRVEGAMFGGVSAHAGQCWDGSSLSMKAGAARVEVVEVEVK